MSFEKRILDIYQNCKNITAVRKAFAALNRQLDARKNAHAAELRSILLTESREAKGQALEKTKADIDKYLRDVEYWNQFEEPEVDHKLHYWKIDNWGEKIFGSHGVLFLGAFMTIQNSSSQFYYFVMKMVSISILLKMRLSPHWRRLMIRMFAILNRQKKNNLIFTGFMLA